MGKSLGVNIKIDYSDIEKLKSALKSIEKPDVKINFGQAETKINSIKKQIDALDNKPINLKMNVSDVMNDLSKVQDAITRIKSDMSKGLDFNLDGKNFKNNLSSAIENVQKSVSNTNVLKNSGISNIQKTADLIEKINNETKSGASRTSNLGGSDLGTKKESLKDILSLMKSINSLETKSLGLDKNSQEFEVMQGRVNTLKETLNSLASSYKSTFGEDLKNNSLFKSQSELSEYNLAIKKAAQETASNESNLKEVVSLLNQQYQLSKKSDSEFAKGNSNTAKSYSDQAEALSKLIDQKKKNYDLDNRLNQTQKDTLDHIQKTNDMNLRNSRDLLSSKGLDKAQTENYKEIYNETKKIYDLREKMSQLQAMEDKGVSSNKHQSANLRALKEEIELRQENLEKLKQEKSLSKAQHDTLSSYEKTRNNKLKTTSDISAQKADLAKIEQAYDQIAESQKKVSRYASQMENAGDAEASALRRLISLEEQRQAQIRETNRLKENGLNSREDELSAQKKLNAETLEQADALRKARNYDEYNKRMATNSTLTDLINPREVYQNAKQAAVYMFDTVKAVDDQMVNIAKVVDAPEKELKQFANTIYDVASTVGRTADQYGVSVERWASSGKTLKESIQLGRYSTIGSFVGNVDEADMVNYMSVPLNAFRKEGLEATDIINAMNEVANNNAIEMTDLGEAYKIASSIVAQSGTSFADFTGLVSGAQEVTRRGGNVIGNAVKAMGVNLGKIAAQSTKADQKKFDFFKNMGVNLTDANGELRSTYDILNDLNGAWSKLSSSDKAIAGFNLAGKHYQSILSGMMDGWEYVQKARSEAMGQLGQGETGSAFKEFAVQQDSLEFKLAALKNAWSEFINVVSGGKGAFASVMEFATNSLQKLTELAKDPAIRALGGTLLKTFGALTGAVAAKQGFNVLKQGVSALTYPFASLISQAGSAKSAMDGLGETGKAVSGISKLAAGFTKWTSIAGAAITILDLMGVDVWGAMGKGIEWVSEILAPATVGMRKFAEAHNNFKDSIANNKLLNGTIANAEQIARKYTEIAGYKEQAARAFQDTSLLKWDDKEFSNLQNDFNNMIDALELDQDLKITWNNHDHIMRQLSEFNKELAKVKASETNDAVKAYSEWKKAQVSGKDSLAEYRESGWGSLDKNKKLKQRARKNIADKLGYKYNGEDDDEAFESELHNGNKTNKKAQELRELYDKATSAALVHGMLHSQSKFADYINEAVTQKQELDSIRQKLVGDLSKSYQDAGANGVGTAIDTLFKGKGNVTGYKSLFVDTIKDIDSYRRNAELAGQALAELSQIQTDVGNGINVGYDKAREFTSKYASVISALGESNSQYGALINKGIDNLNTEELGTLIQGMQKYQKAQQDIYDTTSSKLRDLANEYGMTQEKVQTMMDTFAKNKSEFSKSVMKNFSEEDSAEILLGAGYGNRLPTLFKEVNLDWQSIYQKAQESVDGKKIPLEVAYDLQLVNEQGSVTGEGMTKMLDLYTGIQRAGFDPIEIGFNISGQDNIQQFTDLLAIDPSKFDKKFNLEFDSETGLVTVESFIAALEGQFGKEFVAQLMADTTTAEDSLNKVKSDIEGVKQDAADGVTMNVTVSAEIDGTVQTQFNNIFGGEDLAQQVGVTIKAVPKLEDGNIDVKQLLSQGIPKEVEQEIRAKYSIKPGDVVTEKNVSDYLYETLQNETYSGELTVEKKAEILTTLFPSLKLDSAQLEAEKAGINEEIEGEVNDGETPEVEQTVDVNAKTGEVNTEELQDIENFANLPNKEIEFYILAKGVQDAQQQMSTVKITADELNGLEAQFQITSNGADTEETRIANLIQKAYELNGFQAALDVMAQVYGEDKVEVIKNAVEQVDGVQAKGDVNVNVSGGEEAKNVKEAIQAADGQNAQANLSANAAEAKQNLDDINAKLDALNSKVATPIVNLNKSTFDIGYAMVVAQMAMLNGRTVTVRIAADASSFYSTLGAVKSSSGSVTISIRGRKASMAIGGNQLGKSFSASVGSALGISKSSTIGKSKSTSSSGKDKTINEDVWRYWAKEMFEGIPLEDSLEDLTRELKRAKGNEAKLIELYRKQIALSKEQMQYQKELKSLQQQEMSEILSKLQGHGFTTSGNNVTNLSHAKSFSGDNASTVESLLNDWKKLYESLNSIDKKLGDLELTQFNAEQDIVDAETKQELKQIEKTLKRSEMLLQSVKNNTSLLKAKESMVGDNDYELSLSVKEEGINTSAMSIRHLIDEFNALSNMYVKYSENAEDIQDSLEDLKDAILDNADAILEYREQMEDVKLDRLSNDYEKFSDRMSSNIDRISSSVDALKEGLISGTNLKDLQSSVFGDLDFTRKTGFERQQEERLRLEAELNDALQGYAEKNIDRTKYVANSVLSIERTKYNALLEMASEHSKGAYLSAINNLFSDDIGLTKAMDSTSNAEYDKWQSKLKEIHNEYSRRYADMVGKYDDLSKQNLSDSQRLLLNNKMVLSQLRLQEDAYRKIVETNKQMIEFSKKELENTSLTTEQRQSLLDAIEKYEESSIDAQQSIRETIKSRYEYEFDQLDQLTKKSERHTKALEHILEIAELVNTSSEGKQPIYDAIYASKVREYTNAKDQLAALSKEQDKFAKGSYEWNLLEDKINDVRDALQETSAAALNANKEVLSNSIKTIKDGFEEGLFDGNSLEAWKQFRENWVTGLAKELSLENLRQKSLEYENEMINRRLEALDMQDKVSQKDLDYIDKQLKVIELQSKLNNLDKQRKVQVLARRDDGTWGWDYVADQTEYDKTKSELNTAEKDLEKYKQDQRVAYAEAMGNILEKASNGEYATSEQLMADINSLRDVYGFLGSENIDLTNLTPEQIAQKYKEYLANNGMIIGDVMGSSDGTLAGAQLSNIGLQFETAFTNISTQLGAIIGAELRNALLGINETTGLGNVYHIEALEFPNVTDTTGFHEVLTNLSTIAMQQVTKK